MSLVLYNTMTRRKEPFVPLEHDKIKIYVCGPTVYDHSHIGHARAVVVFDVLVRHLRSLGQEVLYVRNFTDLDDKIIQRAQEEGVAFLELADRHIRSFHEDMDALGALRPDAEPRATDHIDLMIADIEALMAAGVAYQAGGDVYYDVKKLPAYGRLSGRNIEEMRAGARIKAGERKLSPLDFALWKESKPGEPSWSSPWGDGRPGWHIECSAMSRKFLGDVFDIHGGGLDLVFPHHENEIAQSAALGRKFARYWIHNGFVRVNQEKMSKSLKNFFTVKEVLAKFHPEVLRLFLVSKHYRSPIDFSEENLEETRRSLDRAYRALKLAGEHGVKLGRNHTASMSDELMAGFREAMNDDLNTAKALGCIFEGVRKLNRIFEQKVNAADMDEGQALTSTVISMGSVLGVLGRDPEEYFGSRTSMGLAGTDLGPEKIEEMIRARAEARAGKDWAEADRIRDELKGRGVILEDVGQETRWRVEG